MIEDQNIVKMFLNRDESAIENTQTKYGRKIQAVSYEITKDYETAKECENDTYLNAWNLIPPNEPYDYLYSFLIRICRHISLDMCRKRSAQKRHGDIAKIDIEMENILPGINNIEEWIEDSVLTEILNGFVAGLKEEQRNIFIRRYWYLDSVKQIAQGYGISESKVKITLYRCRGQLKKILNKEGYYI